MKVIQTRRGLAKRYGIHHETFSIWLKKIGIDHRCALTPIELEMVYTKIGSPEKLKELAALMLK